MHEQSTVVMWIFFGLGQIAYMLKGAAAAVRNTNSPILTRRQFFSREWDLLLFRGIVSSALFWGWTITPADLLSSWISKLGFQVDFQIPYHPLVALLFGLSSDVLMDYLQKKLPWLKIPGGNGAAIVIAAILMPLLLTGCLRRATGPDRRVYTFEQYARDAIRGGGAFLVQSQNNHPECKQRPAMRLCQAINVGIDIHEAAKQMLNGYCSAGSAVPG